MSGRDEVIINGVEYVPRDEETPNIGVGVTTRDRHDALVHTVAEIRRLTPGARVVIVDDASKTPAPEHTYRFTENVGVARAKNKCLDLLRDCDHIFLFDDDHYPISPNWWVPYVESPEPHLMWMFQKPKGHKKNQLEVLYQDDRHVAYHATRGGMLYVERRVLDVVGGMDPSFGLWGWEHVSWSDRIHSAGLTTYRYADVVDSAGLIHSMDEAGEITSTATEEAKRFASGPGWDLRMSKRHSSEYVEYRDLSNVVITTLFTSQKDPQRGNRMRPEARALKALHDSVACDEFIVLHDEPITGGLPGADLVQVPTDINPYFQRHLSILQYLRGRDDIGYVWCVDGTDVEMLRSPFPEMEPGVLYLGSEPSTLRNEWMVKNHPDTAIQELFRDRPNLQLLNAGLIGGEKTVVEDFLQAIVKLYFDDHIDFIFGWEHGRLGVGDMGALNLVAREQFGDMLSYGSHVNTVFKADEKGNTVSWWKHK